MLRALRVFHPVSAQASQHRLGAQPSRISSSASEPAQMFTARINHTTGESEWVVVEASTLGEGGEGDATAERVASSLYLDMLTDARRNAAYNLALGRVLALPPPGAEGGSSAPTVLDIGTGTGLLALLAGRALAERWPGRQHQVVACELFPPMARLAQRVMALNPVQGVCMRVVPKRSDELTVGTAAQNPVFDLPGPVDVIVSEIVDSELLGEGLLPTMRHAAIHLLKPGGRAIPVAATLWGQLVDSPSLWAMASLSSLFRDRPQDAPLHTPLSTSPGESPKQPQQSQDNAITQVLGVLRRMDENAHASAGAEHLSAAGSAGSIAWQRMRELHVGPLWHAGLLMPVSAPIRLLDLDLERPSEENLEQDVQVLPTRQGQAHALVMWWQMHLDAPTTDLVLSTAPPWVSSEIAQGGDGGPLAVGVAQQWRGHWKQCWTPLGDDQPLPINPGQPQVGLRVRTSAITVSLGVQRGSTPHPQAAGQHGPGWGLVPLREWMPAGLLPQLSSTPHWAPYQKALAQALQTASQGAGHQGLQVICLGSGMVLPVMAASMVSAARIQVVAAAAVEAAVRAGGATVGSVAEGAAAAVDRVSASSSAAAAAVRTGGASADGVAGGATVGGPTSAVSHPAPLATVMCLCAGAEEQRWVGSATTNMGCDHVLKFQQPVPYFKRMRALAQHHKQQQQQEQKQKHQEQQPITESTPAAKTLVVIMAEPRWQETQGMLPWAALLRLWGETQVLRQAFPGADIQVVPGRAVLRAVAASMPDLHRTRQALSVVHGVDLSAANVVLGTVGRQQVHMAAHDSAESGRKLACLAPLALQVWQCGEGYAEMSQRAAVFSVGPLQPQIEVQGSCHLQVRGPGLVHALILWVDWYSSHRVEDAVDMGSLDEQMGGEGLLLNAGGPQGMLPTSGHQAVLLLHEPLDASSEQVLHVKAQLDPDSSSLIWSITQVQG